MKVVIIIIVIAIIAYVAYSTIKDAKKSSPPPEKKEQPKKSEPLQKPVSAPKRNNAVNRGSTMVGKASRPPKKDNK